MISGRLTNSKIKNFFVVQIVAKDYKFFWCYLIAGFYGNIYRPPTGIVEIVQEWKLGELCFCKFSLIPPSPSVTLGAAY